MNSTDLAFQRMSACYLRKTYLPRIRRALEVLPEGDLWWNPHGETNSIGHLLLHLTGNVQQWIVAGVGGAPDQRERDLEFHPRELPTGAELIARLEQVVAAACEVIERLPADELSGTREIQASSSTVFEAIYHVVEHFSWHTGQIISIAKQRAGADHGIAFFDDAALRDARN